MRMHLLVVAAGLALLATAVTGEDAEAQRGRGRGRGAALQQLSCPGAVATEFATTAQEALNRTMISRGSQKQDYYQDALEQSTAGLAADSANPHHHYQRAQALLGLTEFHGQNAGVEYTALFPQSTTIQAGEALQLGSAALRRAIELCPELAAEGANLRTMASQTAFNLATERYQAADTAAAIALWQVVAATDSSNIDALFNAGLASSQRGDQATAVTILKQVMERTTAEDTARTEQRAATLSLLMAAAGSMFQEEKFAESGDVYSYIHTADPSNRDAWYNHSLALYKLQRWTDLIPVAARVVEMDPLNYNAQIVLFNAYKGVSDAAKARNDAATERTNRDLALRTLERADALPIAVDNVTFTEEPGAVLVKGVATGSAAPAGTQVQLEFTLTDAAGEVGRGTVSVAAPAKDQTANFEVRIPVTRPATSYHYRKM